MKNRIIAFLICFLMAASLINLPPVNVSASEPLLVNESFDGYATNAVPDKLNIKASACFVKEYTEGNKGLFVSGDRKVSELSYSFAAKEKITISFDIMSALPNLTGVVKIGQSAGTAVDILSFAKMNEIKNHNGYHVAGYSDKAVTNIALGIDTKKNAYDIYVNGKLSRKDVRVLGKSLSGVNSLVFTTSVSDETGSGYILDNLNVHEGTVPRKSYPVAEFNPAAEPEPEIQTEAVSGSSKMIEETFESAISHTVANKQNTIAQVKEENGNTALLFERLNASDFHLDCTGVNSTSDYVVYEYDINVINPGTSMTVNLKDVNANYSTIGVISKGNMNLGGKIYPVDINTWYRVSAVYNFFDRTKTYYVNGELFNENVALEELINSGADIGTFRFYCGAGAVESAPVKFMIDNARVYESPVPLENLDDMKKEILIDKSRSIFSDDSQWHSKLSGYIALHARSGMLYHDAVKTRLKNEPYKSGDSWMIPAKEVSDITGVKFSETETGLTVNNKNTTNFETVDNVKYVSADTYFATLLGKKVYHDTESKNTGLVIAGNTMFEPDTAESTRQNLNNYLFYQRPSQDEIKAAYEASPVKGVHPRIQATKEDFENIKLSIASDSYNAFWFEYIQRTADNLVENKTPLIYELRDGVRLLHVSRDALTNMYTLGMVYQITGDKKYADRAWIDLESICTFPDWHPSHDIDLGEMSAAVAIGYDWMYDAFTPEQRAVIENGFYLNGLFDACYSYQSRQSRLGAGGITTNNHNVVINGGITMGALAFMDVYPEECSYAVSGAIKAVDIMLHQYAPSGAWFEGPHYWEYTTQYTSKMLSTLDSVLGDCYTLDKTQGISTASNYILNMQSDQGIFNYGDGSQASIFVPEMFWISNKYNDILSTAVTMEFSEGMFTNAEDCTLALLFYDEDKNAASGLDNLEKDAYYEGEEVVVFRDKWVNGETTFAGIHGGRTKVTHSHLDGGSFIYDYAGIRWATDLGMAPYDLPEVPDYSDYGTRWKLYMARAESHNTVVINPDEKPDHKVTSFAAIERFESKPKGGIAVMDMTQLLSENASKATRGMFFTDDRNSLVVRDEITLKEASEVYWFMQTKADVEITPNGAILRNSGRTVNLEFTSSVPGVISVGDSVPLPTSPVVENDKMPVAKRIMIKLVASGDVNITVKLTPDNLPLATPVSDYDIPIESWQIPDGEITKLPYPDTIVVAGRNMEVPDSRIIDFVCVEGDYDSVPEITASSSNYSVTVEKGATLSDQTVIYVTDGNLNSKYIVNFIQIPKPVQFDGSVSYAAIDAKASDEPEPHNPAVHAIDGNLSSRWAVSGIDQWINLELKDTTVIDKVALAFISGDKRKAKFDISVSTDGINYTSVYDGWSSGKTTSYEFFEFEPHEAKYVRIGCDGNSAQGLGGWTSLAEVVLMKKN